MLKVEEQSVNNIRVYNEDVNLVLEQCIPDDSLSKILIFFPDPWPKRRHHKRRLIQTDFIQQLRKKLQVNGEIHMATDWEDYARVMMKTLTDAIGFKNIFGDGKFSDSSLRPTTKFEVRGQKLGHQIWDLRFRKQD